MDPIAVILIFVALVAGLGLGWFLGQRPLAAMRAERDAREADFKAAITDLAHASAEAKQVGELRTALETARAEREEARLELASIRADLKSAQALIERLEAAEQQMTARFAEIGGKLLGEAQDNFLKRADERFKQAGDTNDARLRQLLQPVEATLKRYEDGLKAVEGERKQAYGNLTGLIEAMRVGQESVRSEAAKLANTLRSASKARGQWGEQQLRNVLETCGLAEHTDFEMEVSVEGEGGRLRPDAIVRVPGGKSLVIDAKVSLNAYQDAQSAADDAERLAHLEGHLASMKRHINQLGAKEYQRQFDDTPDYVIMFVPGEQFLAAALDHDAKLWDYAFERRVLIATPTNLIAIARTVAAVWRQEKLAGEAREIAALGRELYARLSTMGGHVARLGKNLETATSAYNAFVGSLESQVLTSARRFEQLNIDTGGKTIDPLPVVEQGVRPLTKLTAGPVAQAQAGAGDEAAADSGSTASERAAPGAGAALLGSG